MQICIFKKKNSNVFRDLPNEFNLTKKKCVAGFSKFNVFLRKQKNKI